MNEKFRIVELKEVLSLKTNKPFYYAVVYSNLEYLINVFLTKDQYDILLKDYKVINLNDFIEKRYNKEKREFSYYINYPKK